MMKQNLFLPAGIAVSILFLTAVSPSSAQDKAADKTLGTIERYDSAFDKLIPQDAELEILAAGFTWCEGPVWMTDKSGGFLLFSDIPRNTVYKRKEGEGVSA